MLVFIDESGDPGMSGKVGASPVFVITAVVFSNPEEAERCAASICELRKILGLDDRFEFHFNKCADKFRRAFLERVAPFKFYHHSFVVNKDKLYGEGFKHKNSFYKFVCGMVADNLKPHLASASLTFDKCGDRAFKQQLSKYLKGRINDGECDVIRKVKFEESHTNQLLQLADMICGAVARSRRIDKDGHSIYRDLVRQREWKLRVWP
jgi:uncharacterized protein DUF3800